MQDVMMAENSSWKCSDISTARATFLLAMHNIKEAGHTNIN
jgi:hypothetical protein